MLKRREGPTQRAASLPYMLECVPVYSDDASSTLSGWSCAYATSTPSIATSTDIAILPTMSAGEVLIAFFLFCIILIMLARGLFSALDRIRTRRKVLGYSGGDVELRDDA